MHSGAVLRQIQAGHAAVEIPTAACGRIYGKQYVVVVAVVDARCIPLGRRSIPHNRLVLREVGTLHGYVDEVAQSQFVDYEIVPPTLFALYLAMFFPRILQGMGSVPHHPYVVGGIEHTVEFFHAGHLVAVGGKGGGLQLVRVYCPMW